MPKHRAGHTDKTGGLPQGQSLSTQQQVGNKPNHSGMGKCPVSKGKGKK